MTTPGSHAIGFIDDLAKARAEFTASTSAGPVALQDAFAGSIALLRGASEKGAKVIFIGNGGSAGISSHQAVDLWKNGGIEAIAFNDASLLTCIGNDLGYENVFAAPVRRFAKPGDVLIAISSSGKSSNILNAVGAAREMKCSVITFSGFLPENPLRTRGDFNFFVASKSYGIVEVSHLALIHAMIREIISLRPESERIGY